MPGTCPAPAAPAVGALPYPLVLFADDLDRALRLPLEPLADGPQVCRRLPPNPWRDRPEIFDVDVRRHLLHVLGDVALDRASGSRRW